MINFILLILCRLVGTSIFSQTQTPNYNLALEGSGIGGIAVIIPAGFAQVLPAGPKGFMISN
ncbi:hypothetical protein [Pontibacter brevis]